MSYRLHFFLITLLFIVCGCETPIKREIASLGGGYSYKSEFLKPIGEEGILFNLDRNIFLDGNSRELGTCRVDDPPDWPLKLEAYLKALGKPAKDGDNYFQKFHVLQLKRGDSPGVELYKNEDDVVILSINYVKKQIFPKGTQADFKIAEMKCENRMPDLVLKENIYTWPEPYDLLPPLRSASPRPQSKAFSNTEFIKYMASKNVLIQTDLDQLKKNHQTFWSLDGPIKLWGDEIFKRGKGFESIDFWIKTISQKSRAAQKFQLLNINLSTELKFGIEVEQLVNRFSTRQVNQYDPARIILNSAMKESNLKIPRLKDLDDCLAQFKGVFLRQPAESKESDYSNQPENFLSPGHLCEPPLEAH